MAKKKFIRRGTMELLFENGFISRKPPRWAQEERKCVQCGKPFFPNTANQKTCSRECGQLMAIERKRVKSKIYYENKRSRHRNMKPVDWTGARHIGSKSERKDAVLERIKRKQNMEELIRIANLSNGDYGKWVAENDNGRAAE